MAAARVAAMLCLSVARARVARPAAYWRGLPISGDEAQPGLSLLQTAATSGARVAPRAVPSDFFEDGLLGRGASLLGEATPFDVGADAVPMPNEFESPGAWPQAQRSLDRISALQSAKRTQAAAPAPPPSDAQPQPADDFGGLPPGAALNPLLLEDGPQPQAAAAAAPAPSATLPKDLQDRHQLEEQVRQLKKQLQLMDAAPQQQSHLLQQESEQQSQSQQQVQQQGQQQGQQQVQQQVDEVQQQEQQQQEQQQQPLRRKEEDAISEDAAPAQSLVQEAPAVAQAAANATSAASAAPATRTAAPVGRPAASSWLESGTSSADYEDSPGRPPSAEAEGASQLAEMSRSRQEALRAEALQQQLLAQQYQLRLRQRQSALLAQRRAAWEKRLRMLHEQQIQLANMERQVLRNMSQQQQQQQNAGVSFLRRVAADGGASREDDFSPRSEHCTQQCAWKCTNPVCDQECKPECESPKCQTRCSGLDLSQCRMNCGKPQCAVLCPERACSGADCSPCSSHCSEPMCMLQCPKSQPCHNVCEQPKCTWKCRPASTCPKPVCHMACDTPSTCAGSSHQQLPPLQHGEVLVQSFAIPQAEASATMSVPVETRASAAAREPGAAEQRRLFSVDMPAVHSTAVYGQGVAVGAH